MVQAAISEPGNQIELVQLSLGKLDVDPFPDGSASQRFQQQQTRRLEERLQDSVEMHRTSIESREVRKFSLQFRSSWQKAQSRLARLARWQLMQPPMEISVSRNSRSRSGTLPWQVSQVAPAARCSLWLNKT